MMKKIVMAASLLFFTFFGATSFASEPSITFDTAKASENISTFAGDVVITFDKGKDITINAAKMIRGENEFVLKGNVEIKYDNLVFHTEKAAVQASDNTVLIKMKSCEIKNT